MAHIADRLRKELRNALQRKIIPLAAIRKGAQNAESLKGVEQLVGDGHHPVHAIVPSLVNIGSPHVALTTPYLLAGFSEREWLENFARQQIARGTVGAEERLHRHMKYGKDDWYWSEFVFYGYVNHRADAILLSGFPDRPETQPQHKRFDAGTFDEHLVREALTV